MDQPQQPHGHHQNHDEDSSWQPSDEFLAHAMTPQNLGILPKPDGYSNPTGSCGDNLELFLKIDRDQIRDARFMTNGCMHTIACGSALTTLLKGQSVDKASNLSYLEIEAEVGGLPENHMHCATLAEGALDQALADYREKQAQPWKRIYQK